MTGHFHEKAGEVNTRFWCLPFLDLQSPNRPASIRTLGGAVGSGASWRPQFQRVPPSRNRTERRPLPEAHRSARKVRETGKVRASTNLGDNVVNRGLMRDWKTTPSGMARILENCDFMVFFDESGMQSYATKCSKN